MKVEVYCDSSWKGKKGVFAFYDTHTECFYVSNLFVSDTSVTTECIAAYAGLMHVLKNPDVTEILVHSDLDMISTYNLDLHSKNNLTGAYLNLLAMTLSIFDDVKIKFKYTNRTMSNAMRLVDILAYRKIKNMNLHAHKPTVFGIDYQHKPINDVFYEQMKEIDLSDEPYKK